MTNLPCFVQGDRQSGHCRWDEDRAGSSYDDLLTKAEGSTTDM